MVSNGWLKLGLISLIGIVISMALLSLISPGNIQTSGANGQMNMYGQNMGGQAMGGQTTGTQSSNIHQQHVQQGLHGNTGTGAQGMTNGYYQQPAYNGMQYDYSYLQQQLNQIQMQLYQMQQNNMNGMQQNSMQQSGMGAMSGMSGM